MSAMDSKQIEMQLSRISYLQSLGILLNTKYKKEYKRTVSFLINVKNTVYEYINSCMCVCISYIYMHICDTQLFLK